MAYGFAINTSAGFVDTLDFYTARLKETITATLPANTTLPEAGNGVYLNGAAYEWTWASLGLTSYDPTEECYFVGEIEYGGSNYDSRWDEVVIDYLSGGKNIVIDSAVEKVFLFNDGEFDVSFTGAVGYQITIIKVKV
tara:strand:+ start:362 stop:775 length:414 start_codon:yes stop_codon:yes gene_type:complete